MNKYHWILIFLLTVSLYFNINFYSENDSLKQQKDDFSAKHKDFKRQLESQARERMVLVDSISNLNRDYQDIVLKVAQNEKELKEIKGKYNNIKPSELSELMEDRASGK